MKKILSFAKWMCILSCITVMASPAAARDHKIGFTGGAGWLYGDNTNSDPGPSIGLTYEMVFSPLISLGVDGAYQRLSGESRVTDPTSIFQGSHAYDTSFLMLGLFNRLHAPLKKFQPYLSYGAGAAMWFPSKNSDIESLPMERKISWSLSPFAIFGAGVSVPLGNNWGIDIGAKWHYFFSDELDNLDGEYVTGRSSGNDYSMQTGITIFYRIGEKAESERERTPNITPPRPQPLPPPVTIPEETPPEPEETDIPTQQEQAPDIDEAETDDTPGVRDDQPIPEPVTEESPVAEPEPIAPPPVIDEEPAAPIIPAPQRTVRRPFYVHVASFPTTEEAENRAASLITEGYRTRIMSVDRSEIGVWFRVYVGPYGSRSQAERAAARVMQAGLSDYAAVVEMEE